MSPELNELLEKALQLPPEAREALATQLYESLDATAGDDTDSAWHEEISKRMEEIRSGKAKTIPWEEVKKKGRALLDGK